MPDRQRITVGQRFGRWTTIRRMAGAWLCRCACGAERGIVSSNLTRNLSRSCGCLKRELALAKSRPIVPGTIYGNWSAVREMPRRHGIFRMVLCRCICGAQREVDLWSLQQGTSRSCGCVNEARHGHSIYGARSPTYGSWSAMIQRCTNPNHSSFQNYGGRGIKVCDRWFRFKNFLTDMGDRPIGCTLDRFPDNNGNYEPGNCRWATPKQQASNKRRLNKGV